MTLLLVLGLGAVFAGIAFSLAGATALVSERSARSRTLAGIEAAGGEVSDSLRAELDPSFEERVLVPLRALSLRLGRRLTPADWAQRTSQRLDKAGNPVGWDVERVLAMKGLLALGLGGAWLLLVAIAGWGLPGVLATAPVAALGFYGPEYWLSRTARNRADEINRALPDTLDLISISMAAGLSFDAAMQQVADRTTGPLAGEFKRALHEVQLGTNRADALKAMTKRCEVPALDQVIHSLIQGDKLGIPLSQVMLVQADEMRTKRTQQAEETAARIPVKMLFPLLVLIMPATFIVVLSPLAITLVGFFG